jgi:two-component system alkaline phosphatase synthesis response regulator PhoP
VLRRSATPEPTSEVIQQGELRIDVQRHEVTFSGTPVDLTATEFRILHFLAGRPGRVRSREEIIEAALGGDVVVTDRTVDVHVTAIRKKLGSGGERIATIRGFGYKFKEQTAG